MGSIYKRKNSANWWIKYYEEGKPYRESSGSTRKRDAQRLLAKRQGAIATGKFTGIQPEKTTLEELFKDLVNDYKINRKRNLSLVKHYVKQLKAYFGGIRAQSITTDMVRAYVAQRQEEVSKQTKRTPAPATINRELSAFRRALNLGRQAGKVVRVPHMPMLREDNVRKGFFNHRDYLRLTKVLPVYLKPLVTLAYFTGMRQGEILKLRWAQVDFTHRLIRLVPGTTKNRQARTVPMSEELHAELHEQRRLRDRKFPGSKWVFFNHKTGKPILSFVKAWKTACKRIGRSNALFHDLRRTGVRNLVRAGVPENVAMAISGHKTRSVFDRYDIVDEVGYPSCSGGRRRVSLRSHRPTRTKGERDQVTW